MERCTHPRCSALLRIERAGLTAYLHCDVCGDDLGTLPNQTAQARAASTYSSHELEVLRRASSFIRTAREIRALPEPARERLAALR